MTTKATKTRTAKAFLALSTFGICAVSTNAATVSGTIVNQIWTRDNSPYRVVGDVLVAGLTIRPGVTVLFTGNYAFEVAGRLRASGTSDAPVEFQGPTTGWQGIFFNHSGPSLLAFCSISNSVNSGIQIVESNPRIAHCMIADNRGTNGGGINASLTTGELSVEHCNFLRNSAATSGGGISAVLGSNAVLRLDGCLFSGNTANPTKAYGNHMGGAVYVSGSTVMTSCVIRSNSCLAIYPSAAFGGGIFSEKGTIDLRNCIVSGNQATANEAFTSAAGGGLLVSSGSLKASNSIVSQNASNGATSQGGGVRIMAGATNSSLINCSIVYNKGEGIFSDEKEVQVMNSILYFNDVQMFGVTNVTYSDVQSGITGAGNINANPVFLSTADPIVVPGSPCVNRGNTNSVYNNLYFPPSLGAIHNDIGAHGGPGAGAAFKIVALPQIALSLRGCVPGFTYALESSTNLVDWKSLEQFQSAYLGDIHYYFEPATNALQNNVFRLNIAR